MLTIEGIKQIIEAGEPQWIKDIKAETVKLQVHVNGIGVEEYLERIETYENKRQYELRKKYFTSNRHLFGNLLRHVDKVFTAQGGSKFYGIDEDKKPDLLFKLSDVRHGKGIRKWIESVQANKYYSDPSGLVFFEWTKEETYPTLKSINTIFNYQAKGRNVDWIIFMPVTTDEGEFYRVVDEGKDVTIRFYQNKYTIVEQYKNPWGRVPAIINSDRLSPTLLYHESPVQDVIELADKYLRTSSVKNIYEFLHGFPLFWAYAPKCTKCSGTGLFEGDTCPSCNGDGNTFRKDVSDILKLRPPSDSEEPKLAPDIAGYVEPADRTWSNQREELEWLWRMMHYTLWGTLTFERSDRETALGRFIDIQPVNDKLDKFSDAFEDMEQKMVQFIGEFYFPDYGDTAINYGRIYMLESPDDIYKRYMEARRNGSPKVLLDYFLTQYYQSEFVNDTTKLTIYTKAMRIEPFVHKTDEEIMALGIPELSASKIYFNEWYLSLSEDYILSSTEEQLKEEYKVYLNAKVQGKSA